jgi:hypothetical protein
MTSVFALFTPRLVAYVSVEGAPFSLSDLVRASLFFKPQSLFLSITPCMTREVVSDGTPVLLLEREAITHEMKLGSRYQNSWSFAF